MPITSNNGVWTNLVLKINATPSQKQRKSLLRFRIRYLRFSRSTASKKECPPNLWKVKSLRISCQNDMSRLCNHHKPTNRWKSISLYRDTNTHTHINQFTHTHTHHWFGFLGRRSHLKVILFRPYRLSEAIGYQIWSQTLPAQFGTKGTSPRWIWCSQHGFLIFLNVNQSWMSILSLLAQKILGLRCYFSNIHSQLKWDTTSTSTRVFWWFRRSKGSRGNRSAFPRRLTASYIDIFGVSHTLMYHRLPCWKA